MDFCATVFEEDMTQPGWNIGWCFEDRRPLRRYEKTPGLSRGACGRQLALPKQSAAAIRV